MGCDFVVRFDTLCFWGAFVYYYKTHSRQLLELYDGLGDEESRNVLCEYVTATMFDRGYGRYDLWRHSHQKYIDKSVYGWLDAEYVVCCGANIGDTFCNFVSAGFPFDKMYMIEGNRNSVHQGKKYLSYLPENIRKKAEWHNVFLDAQNPLEVICKDKRVTLIEMDIEGAESAAIESCLKVITEQRPVVAVCAYHRTEDLITLPEFFVKNFRDYKLFLRKYYCNTLRFSKDEMVLYAVPVERLAGGCAEREVKEGEAKG
jgi:hypothetical protein